MLFSGFHLQDLIFTYFSGLIHHPYYSFLKCVTLIIDFAFVASTFVAVKFIVVVL